MKEGIVQAQAKSLMDWFITREIHPIYAMEIMARVTSSILAGYIQNDMGADERAGLGVETETFAIRLRDMIQESTEDLFPILLAVQSLQQELVHGMKMDVEKLEAGEVDGVGTEM